MNDATREAGGTLGVAVIGSVATSFYLHHLSRTAVAGLPAHLAATARSSVGAALAIAAQAPASQTQRLISGVTASFMSGLHVACAVAAGVCWIGAIGAIALPGRPARAAMEV
jgi:hypothetical protein